MAWSENDAHARRESQVGARSRWRAASCAMTHQPSLVRRRARYRTGDMPYEYVAEGSSTEDGQVPRNRATPGGCSCGRLLMRSSTGGLRRGNLRSALVNSLWTTSRRPHELTHDDARPAAQSGRCMRQMCALDHVDSPGPADSYYVAQAPVRIRYSWNALLRSSAGKGVRLLVSVSAR